MQEYLSRDRDSQRWVTTEEELKRNLVGLWSTHWKPKLSWWNNFALRSYFLKLLQWWWEGYIRIIQGASSTFSRSGIYFSSTINTTENDTQLTDLIVDYISESTLANLKQSLCYIQWYLFAPSTEGMDLTNTSVLFQSTLSLLRGWENSHAYTHLSLVRTNKQHTRTNPPSPPPASP